MRDAFGFNVNESVGEHLRNTQQILALAQRWSLDHHGNVVVMWPADFDAVQNRVRAALGAWERERVARRAELDAIIAKQNRTAAILTELETRAVR